MTTSVRERRSVRRWVLGTVPLVAAVSWPVTTAVRHPDRLGMIDLAVYRAGGAALAAGDPLYSAHPEHSALPFTYPPFAGLLCVPLAALGWDTARVLVTLLSLAALLAVVRATVPARPAVVSAVVAAGLCLEPVRATLAFGQVNLLVMALVVLDLTRRAGRPASGVLIGLAAAVKLTPLIFLPYLLLTGRRREAGTALATFAGTVAVGWLVLPAESARYWFHLVAEPERVGGVAYSGNQSLLGALTRLLDGSDVARPLWLGVAAAVGVLGLAGAAALSAAGRELAGIALCGLTGLLVSPISWTHHWVWVLPAGIAAVTWIAGRPRADRRRPAVLLAGAGLLFALAPVWWPAAGGNAEYRHSGWEQLAADSYVLVGLAVLAAAAAWALRATRSAPAQPPGRVDRDAAGPAQSTGPERGRVGRVGRGGRAGQRARVRSGSRRVAAARRTPGTRWRWTADSGGQTTRPTARS